MTQRSRNVQHHGTKETGKAPAKASVNGSVIGDDDEMAAPPAPEEPKGGRGKRAAPATSAKAKRVVPIPKVMKPTPSKETHPTKHVADVDDEDDEDDDNLMDAFVKRKWSSWKISHVKNLNEW